MVLRLVRRLLTRPFSFPLINVELGFASLNYYNFLAFIDEIERSLGNVFNSLKIISHRLKYEVHS